MAGCQDKRRQEKSGTISADDSSSFILASTGQRQNAEQSWLKNGNGNILIEGKKEQYSKYIDCSTGSETTTGETTYYVGTSNLAWHLSEGEESLSPGGKRKTGILHYYESGQSVQCNDSVRYSGLCIWKQNR